MVSRTNCWNQTVEQQLICWKEQTNWSKLKQLHYKINVPNVGAGTFFQADDGEFKNPNCVRPSNLDGHCTTLKHFRFFR